MARGEQDGGEPALKFCRRGIKTVSSANDFPTAPPRDSAGCQEQQVSTNSVNQGATAKIASTSQPLPEVSVMTMWYL